MNRSDWLVLAFTGSLDTRTGLTPAGKLPFHLHIEVLGLLRVEEESGDRQRKE